MDYSKQINEEVEAYFAINGETGAWGESMRDWIGVDIVCENLENGFNINITPEIREIIRIKMKVKN